MPICVITLLLFANRRGETEMIWSGKIFDGKHKNKAESLMDVTKALERSQERDDQNFEFFSVNRHSGSSSNSKRKESFMM
jgi:hypothetical protein